MTTLVELRARWRSDPARRLQYLRRKMLEGQCDAPSQVASGRNWFLRLPLIAGILAIALAGAGLTPACRRMLHLTPPGIAFAANSTGKLHAASPNTPPAKPEFPVPPSVWLVEANPQFDLYSNGLRVENRFAASTQPRAYLAFPRDRAEMGEGEWRFEPVGIVFHTTESHMAPFLEKQNRTLRRAGEGLLEYVRRNRSYHFVIDRFGRVFRTVRESDYANHAGNSVWADREWIYVNLNQSFFGVAFEAQSRGEDEGLPVNPAQVYAARILTEMLLARYNITPGNCVGHAQVSVNPANHSAGYHTDWATNLPFRDLGLADNYGRTLPSVALFGFGTADLIAVAGESPLSKSLQAAQQQIQNEAAQRGLSIDRYRETLQKKYRDATEALRARGVLGENN